MSAATDEIDALLGSAAGADAPLRAARPVAVEHAQGSFEALFTPAEPRGVSVEHRHAIALRVATLTQAPALAARHRAALPAGLADAVAAPQAVFDATMAFHHPAHVTTWQSDDIDARFGEVCALLINGLRSPTEVDDHH